MAQVSPAGGGLAQVSLAGGGLAQVSLAGGGLAQMSPAGGGSRGWGNPITDEGFGKLDTTGEG
ncbi:hypothetical protein KUV50_12410 [Membranicola marinus]|uniref:Uncharacterized protein n=1 Tax=Membranihabitans marinus TaxID=1227546 RepID=A0A953HVC5_9BACT|nr:hypothetical protein [Membranihabitans marinus]MBY5958945.1 hypothetical protein [Membranihabitans marinus]